MGSDESLPEELCNVSGHHNVQYLDESFCYSIEYYLCHVVLLLLWRPSEHNTRTSGFKICTVVLVNAGLR